VYEWQVPYGLDTVYGYESVETAVDVICNEAALENTKMEWKLNGGDNAKGIILENQNTMQQLCLVDAASAPDAIKEWEPNTVVIQCAADKLLTQMKSSLAPTNRTDVYGCSVALAWSTAWFLSPLWPANVALSGLCGAALAAMNGTFLFRTFMHPHDQKLKKVFGAVRKAKANLVLGDWLLEDYDERLNQVQHFDELGQNMEAAPMLGVGDALTAVADGDGGHGPKGGDSGTFDEFMKSVRSLGSTSVHQRDLPALTIDDVSRGDGGKWMRTYRDSVNNRRMDLLAQVLNNCRGEKILLSVDDVDNIKSPIVSQLLQRRLTGDIDIGKPVLKYDTYYERVQVDM